MTSYRDYGECPDCGDTVRARLDQHGRIEHISNGHGIARSAGERAMRDSVIVCKRELY